MRERGHDSVRSATLSLPPFKTHQTLPDTAALWRGIAGLDVR